MTRKDFVLVAKAVGESNIHPCDKMEVFHKVGNALAVTNTNFSMPKFINYCNLFIKEEI